MGFDVGLTSMSTIKRNEIIHLLKTLAERMGFEPTRPFRAYSLSRGAPSTTRPPLR